MRTSVWCRLKADLLYKGHRMIKRCLCGGCFLFLTCLYTSKPVEWLDELINSLGNPSSLGVVVFKLCFWQNPWNDKCILSAPWLQDSLISHIATNFQQDTAKSCVRRWFIPGFFGMSYHLSSLEKKPFPTSNIAIQKYIRL